MVLGNIVFGQKDLLIAKGIGEGLDRAERYLKNRYDESDEIDLEEDPAFEQMEEETDVYVFDPKTDSEPNNGGDNDMTTEAPEYIDETEELLEDLGTALERKDTATAERRAEEVKEQVYDLLDDVEEVEDAFQQYDESMRDHMDDWTDTLGEYLERLDEMNQSAHNAARDLMETERALQEYELDERTEELVDIAYEL